MQRHQRYTYDKLAVPNEFRTLYSKNGISDLNATTGRDVTAYYCSMPANVLELWLKVESERFLAPVFREFQTELRELAGAPVQDRELEKAKSRLETATLERIESNLGLARALAIYEITASGNGWEYLRDVIEARRKVMPEDIMRVCREYFRPERMTVAVLEPQ